MIQWFLFNGVDAKAGAPTVGIENHLVAFNFSYKAKAPVPFFHAALTRAQIANDTIGRVIAMPPFS